ncbi:MAG: hypothetical protein PHT96_14745 [Syntrophorhabdaceae bacterium]|nr:hypothetical protein [Syntrophorhabdaceae bacterium]MDD4197645.1 hypothetical protein [Syntrophorhabdaceae bacterium]
MLNQVTMMLHVVFGILGILFAVALYVDVLNASERNLGRVKMTGWIIAACMVMSFVIGGYWYVLYYPVHRSIIMAGPWPWAHKYFMELKEHLFLTLLILSLYLPVAVHNSLPLGTKNTRRLILGLCALIVLLGLFMELSGAIIGESVKMGLSKR